MQLLRAGLLVYWRAELLWNARQPESTGYTTWEERVLSPPPSPHHHHLRHSADSHRGHLLSAPSSSSPPLPRRPPFFLLNVAAEVLRDERAPSVDAKQSRALRLRRRGRRLNAGAGAAGRSPSCCCSHSLAFLHSNASPHSHMQPAQLFFFSPIRIYHPRGFSGHFAPGVRRSLGTAGWWRSKTPVGWVVFADDNVDLIVPTGENLPWMALKLDISRQKAMFPKNQHMCCPRIFFNAHYVWF